MNDKGLLLGVGISVGVVVLLVLIFTIVFSSIRRTTARIRGELQSEGIILDSGPRWISIHMRGFRAPGVAVGVGVNKSRASLIFTKQRVVMVPSRRRFLHIDCKDLGRYTVKNDAGALVLHSDDPPNATGTIEWRVVLDDTDAWVRALTEAGARSADQKREGGGGAPISSPS